jgi:glycosyltransferase involved in cell wall biosynthesis
VRHIVREHGREDVHFAVVGGGPELEALKALARRLEIEDFVTFALSLCTHFDAPRAPGGHAF